MRCLILVSRIVYFLKTQEQQGRADLGCYFSCGIDRAQILEISVMLLNMIFVAVLGDGHSI